MQQQDSGPGTDCRDNCQARLLQCCPGFSLIKVKFATQLYYYGLLRPCGGQQCPRQLNLMTNKNTGALALLRLLHRTQAPSQLPPGRCMVYALA